MAISASLVKELRDMTGSGMMDCKKALIQTDGDLEAAVDLMRASGAAKAAKKSSRIAAEGVVKLITSDDKKRIAIIEINSETDFATKGKDFINFVDTIANFALDSGATDAESLMSKTLPSGQIVSDVREALVAKIGENISIRRLSILTGTVGAYQHGERIATVVELAKEDGSLAKDIAMHIAASSPSCVNESQVSADTLAREKAIFVEQARESGKPDNIIEKMIAGRMKKFIAETTLYGQAFIKDPDLSVEKLVKNAGNEVIAFVRYEVGEGIEKKEMDFREEVMAQAQGN